MEPFSLEQFAARTRTMADQIAQMQTRLESLTSTGRAGDGLVSVTCNAHGQVSEVSIDPSLLDPAKRELLESLVAEAFTGASASLQERAAEGMQFVGDQIDAVTVLGRDRLDRF